MKINLAKISWLSMLLAMMAVCSIAHAQNANRPLPTFQLRDVSETILTTDLLRMQRNWVLVLVNPALSNTRNVLRSLTNSDSMIGSEMTILLLGSAKELSSAMTDHPKLAGARWYRADPSNVKQQLNVSGFPIVLGVTPAHQIRWQQSGQPSTPEQLSSMIGNWVASAAQ